MIGVKLLTPDNRSSSPSGIPGTVAQLQKLLNKVETRVAMSPVARHLKLSYELLLATKLKNERMAQMTMRHLSAMSRSTGSLTSKMRALAFGPDDMSSVSTTSSAAMSTSKPRLRRRRWYLGIQSKKSPVLVMGEIFRVLASMQLQWKVMSPYELRCRYLIKKEEVKDKNSTTTPLPEDIVFESLKDTPKDFVSETTPPIKSGIASALESESSAAMSEVADEDGDDADHVSCDSDLDDHVDEENDEKGKYVKVGLQLFKVQQGIYLLDFKKIAGHAFVFMGLCESIITNLQRGLSKNRKSTKVMTNNEVRRVLSSSQEASSSKKVGGSAPGRR